MADIRTGPLVRNGTLTPMSSPIRPVHTESAPAAIGPYSQAVVHGGLAWCSGQVALDPAKMELVGDDVASQAERVMQNLRAVLEACDTGVERILRATIYLVDMADFQAVNAVYERHLGDHRPARACVAVRQLPKGALVEIDCVAAVG